MTDRCHEVVYEGGDNHLLCTAQRGTEHSHQDGRTPMMVLLPLESKVALDQWDCLRLVELRGCKGCGSSCGVEGCEICEGDQPCVKCGGNW